MVHFSENRPISTQKRKMYIRKTPPIKFESSLMSLVDLNYIYKIVFTGNCHDLKLLPKNLFLKWRLATWLHTNPVLRFSWYSLMFPNTLDTKSFWESLMQRLCCFCIFDILFPSSESYIFLILIVPWFSWTAPYLRNLCH